MESTGADVSFSQTLGEEEIYENMDTDLIRVSRRRLEPIDILDGIYLKTVHFLNAELTKCIIIGIFKNRGNGSGVLVKGPKGGVFLSWDCFKEFVCYFDDIRTSLENKTTFLKYVDGVKGVKTKKVFGKPCAYLFDREQTVMLNFNEWCQFIKFLPIINNELRELFYNEILIQDYIKNINSGSPDIIPEGLPSLIANQLAVHFGVKNDGNS
jgi:hypothetical protein